MLAVPRQMFNAEKPLGSQEPEKLASGRMKVIGGKAILTVNHTNAFQPTGRAKMKFLGWI
jgi:hypothetical protein